jgi:2-keto-4-pentenoate hydratase/2-oxohepta-3-ene-1,7-dioic acid hydratase in catechol pathway
MALFCRFHHDGLTRTGIVEGNVLRPIDGDLFGSFDVLGNEYPLDEVALLPPVEPRTILAAAVNYQSHVPSGRSVLKQDEAPSVPQLFLKPLSSIIGPDGAIVLPEGARRVDAEGELVAVIGRTCRKVTPEEALDHVFGYTCGNDVSARHWQRDDLQWWRAKGSDTFTAIGPAVATGLDPSDLQLTTRVNGEVKQDSSTSQLIHSVVALISFASQVITLAPGDLIFTGTPGETPTLQDNDEVEVEIQGVGVLRNAVTREPGTVT